MKKPKLSDLFDRKASVQLKVLLSLAIFGIASAFLFTNVFAWVGIHLNSPVNSANISGVYTLNASTSPASDNVTFYWWNTTGASWLQLCQNITAGTEFSCSYDTSLLPTSNGNIFNATASNPDASTTSTGVNIANCGAIITSPVTLTQDLTGCLGTGINITASNVVLDCAGHTISGNSPTGYGVYISSSLNNVTIKNCTIYGFNASNKAGIFVGIYISTPSNNITITDSTFFNNYDGIVTTNAVYGLYNLTIKNNNILNGTHMGIYTKGAQNSTIKGNTVKNQLYTNIETDYGGNNVISDNVLNNTVIFSGIILLSGNAGPDIIQNNSITYSANYGISIASGDTNPTAILDNNITNNAYEGLGIDNVASKLIYHNNIHDNGASVSNSQVYSTSAIFLDNSSSGNYWGHDGCPVFWLNETSGVTGIIDRYAYNSTSGWITGAPALCDAIPVVINNVSVGLDVFVCNMTGHTANSIVHVVVNATDAGGPITEVKVNIDDLSIADVPLSFNATTGLWEGDVNVTDTSSYAFQPVNITIEANDSTGNGNYLWPGSTEPFTTIVLYNMSEFPPGGNPCDRSTTNATVMCDVTDFQHVNYVVEVETNGTCQSEQVGQQLPWADFKRVVTLNFTSLNFTDQNVIQALPHLPEAFHPPIITPPGQFGDSQISVNTSGPFYVLNSNCTVSLYGLPFAETPNVSKVGGGGTITVYPIVLNTPYNITDVFNCSDDCGQELANCGSSCSGTPTQIQQCQQACAAQYINGPQLNAFGTCMQGCGSDENCKFNCFLSNMNTSSQCMTGCNLSDACGNGAQNGLNCIFNMFVPNGDLTFTVAGFSSYNASDTIKPIVNIITPLTGSGIKTNSTVLNFTVNGTGSQISSILVYKNGALAENMSGTDVFSRCANLTPGWDVVICNRTALNLSNGINNITVIAHDFGGVSPGNSGNNVTLFSVDATAPTVTLSAPTVGTVTNNVTINFKFNASDAHLSSCILYYNNSTGYTPNSGAVPNNGTITTLALNLSSVPSMLVNWYVWCNDTSGNEKNSSVWNFTIDRVPPVVTIATPQSTIYGKTVVFNVSTTDAASGCKYSLDGGTTNITMGNSSTTRWNSTNSSMLNGSYNVVLYCSDLYGNVGTNTTGFLVDTISPVITQISPGNTTYSSSVVVFNLTTNENASTCMFSLNGATNITMSSAGPILWYYTNSSMTDRLHNVKFYCTDLYNNTNVTGTTYFTVDTIAPSVTSITNAKTLLADADVSGSSFIVYANYNENMNTSIKPNISYSPVTLGVQKLDCGGSWVSNSSYYFPCNVDDYNETVSNITIQITGAQDLAGHIQNAVNKTNAFSIDTQNPTITIVSPVNAIYGKSVQFNVTTNESASGCNLSLDSGANVTMTKNANTLFSYTNSSMTNGTHSVVFNCKDLAGNPGTNNTPFTIDAIPPTITVNTPVNNTIYSSNVTFDITTGEPASICKFNLDNNSTSNVTMVNASLTSWNYLKINMAETNHNIKFYCIDMYSNTNQTGVVYFTVNNSFGVTINAPTSNAYINSSNVTFNITTLSNASTCKISVDGKANSTMQNATSRNWGNLTTGLADGSHNATVWCNSSTGQSDTKTVFFTVDMVAPAVNIVSPQDITYGTKLLLNVTTNESALWCKYSLIGYDVLMDGGPTIWTNNDSVGSAGQHSVNFSCSDLAGNIGTNITNFTVDNTPPVITIISPENKTYNSSDLWLDITTDEPSSECVFSWLGNPNGTMTNVSTTNWTQLINATNGNKNVVFYCSDVYDNVGSSATTYFTVDTILPTVTLFAPTNNSWTNGGNLSFTFKAVDNIATIMNCTLNIHSMTTISYDIPTVANNVNKTYTVNMSIFTEGAHTWNVNCSDIINQGFSNTSIVNKDSIAPLAAITYPLNASKFNTRTIPVNVTTTETNPVSLQLYTAENGIISTLSYPAGTNQVTNFTFNAPADGTYRFYVTAIDHVNSITTLLNYITIDATPPVISNISVSDITNESATVGWNTNEDSVCKLSYWSNATNLIDPASTVHSQSLSNLTQGTVYHFNITCNDSYNNTANTITHNFTTAVVQGGTFNASVTQTITFNVSDNGTNRTVAEFDVNAANNTTATIEVISMTQNPEGVNFSYQAGIYLIITSPQLNSSNLNWVIINAYYNKSLLPSGIDESTLKLYLFNNGTWNVVAQSGVNTTAHYVWGNVTHFSTYAIGGKATTTPPSGGGGGTPGVISSVGHNFTLTNIEGVNTAMVVGDDVVFTVLGTQHTARLFTVAFNAIVLQISSTPFTVTVNVGDTKQIDVNGDGTADISVYLKKVDLGKAYLTFSTIAQPTTGNVTTPTQPGTQPTTQPGTQPTTQPGTQPIVGDNTTAIVVVIAALIVIMIVVAWWYKNKNK